MFKLSKNDRSWCKVIGLFCIIVGLLTQKFIVLNVDSVLSSISIITGFLLSAIAILYASPLRNVLYDKKTRGYASSWESLVIRYLYTFLLNLIYVFAMLALQCFIPKFLSIAILLFIFLLLIVIVINLFSLLLIEIND